MDEAAAIEPIAVAVHAVNAVACLQPHRNVVVFGAGPVGLMCMAGEPKVFLETAELVTDPGFLQSRKHLGPAGSSASTSRCHV